jgi:hypothetical protein
MRQKLFKDLPNGSTFFLNPQDQQRCVKLGADKYSCYGIVYFIEPEKLVYEASNPSNE